MKGYITFDYELCLGSKTGSAEGCLVEPMNAITKMFLKYNVKSNIFVDAAYLLRMKELKDEDVRIQRDYELVTTNIVFLSSLGHSIQLHFHPQWIDAQYRDGSWVLDNDHYKLSDYTLDIQKEKLTQAIDLLQTLSYNKITAFRAGGFSVENFEDIAPVLNEKGVYIDTSVLRGGVVNSKYQTYNYQNIPLLTSYHFSNSNKKENEKGKFIEYPISVMEINSFSYVFYKNIIRKIRERDYRGYSPKRWNDGVGIGDSVRSDSRIKNHVKRLFINSPLYASADGALVYFLSDVFKYCKRKFQGDDFVIIGHPKIASPRTIAVLEDFIKEHIKEINFVTFN